MAKFSQQFIDRVRQANPIGDVIGEHVQLKKKGKNLMACCPFHNEKTPSFSVSADKGFYKCFGCGKGGNVFSFLMEHDGLSFPEAVESLANRAGIPLEIVGGNAQGIEFAANRRRKKNNLLELCKFAGNFFEKSLYSGDEGKVAREYLKQREITEHAARAFRLGYAPDRWEALRHAANREGYGDEDLVAAGLAIKNDETGSYYDRFRGRLIFPIWDLSGNVIAFGGRLIGEGEPKYLNSPETSFYIKSKVLYPIHLTKRAIQQKGMAILCEGYMDALTLSQFRFTYTVASCGTSLTVGQTHLLKRFAKKVVVAYDGDSAGQEASLKSISVLLEQGIDVYIAGLENGEDPDSFLKKHGREKFSELIKDAVPFFPYLLNNLKKSIDTRTPHGQQQLCEKVFPLLLKFDSEIVRGGYLDELADSLDISRERIATEFFTYVDKKRRVNYEAKRQEKIEPEIPELSVSERELLAIILTNSEALKHALTHLDIEYIEHPTAHELAQMLYTAGANETWKGLELFLNEVTDEQAQLITDILSKCPEYDKNWRQPLTDCIDSLHNEVYSREIKNLQAELKTVSNFEEKLKILERIKSYQKLKKEKVKQLNI